MTQGQEDQTISEIDVTLAEKQESPEKSHHKTC